MIEVHELTKRYGDAIAVDALSFTVQPGVVTGFLGPNGAGKSTTMRMILGLDRADGGTATVNGRAYGRSPAPMAELGALLDARAVDKSRSARNHLRALGATIGIGARRVEEVLGQVGLADVADASAGSYSLGMSQRLGIATALLGDPSVVMLDEPVNGLDPDGIRWIRTLLRDLAREGRTVLLSSHLMSEMELTAEHLVVIGRGRLVADVSMHDFIAQASHDTVRVASPRVAELRDLLAGRGVTVTSPSSGRLEVEGLPASSIGEVAAAHGIPLHELSPVEPSLEQAFMSLTRDSVEFAGGTSPDAQRSPDTQRKAA